MNASPFTSALFSVQNIEVPNSRLNPGGASVPPFATVQLSKGSYMTIYTPAEAYALRDAFQQAGDALAGVTPVTPADVDARHPGWHAWLSSAGRCWATSIRCPQITGSGQTIDADTPEDMDELLARRAS